MRWILIVPLAVLLLPSPAPAQEEVIGGRSLDRWVEILSDPDGRRRLGAIEELGAQGPAAAPAAPLIEAALEDDLPEVRAAAFRALAVIGPRGTETLEARLAAFATRAEAVEVLEAAGVRALPGLIALLESSNWRVRELACWLITKLGEGARPARDALISAAYDEASAVRLAALMALPALGCPAGEVEATYARASEDGHRWVKQAAVVALARLTDGRGFRIQALVRLAEDSDPEIRLLAIHGLREEGPDLVLRAALGDDHSRVRLHAAFALFDRGERHREIADVIAAALPTILLMRVRSFRGRGGHRNLRAMGGGFKGGVGLWSPPGPKAEEIGKAILELAPHSVPGLEAMLHSDTARKRWNAIWLLGEIGGEHAAILVPMLDGSDVDDARVAAMVLSGQEEYRSLAAEVLAKALVDVGLPLLEEVIEDPVIRDSWYLEPESILAAVRRLGPVAVPYLQALLPAMAEEDRPGMEKLIEELSK